MLRKDLTQQSAPPACQRLQFVGQGRNLFRLHHLEGVSRRVPATPIPGEVAPADFLSLQGGWLTSWDGSAPTFRATTKSKANFLVSLANRDSFIVSILAANGGANPAKVLVSRKSALATSKPDTIVVAPTTWGDWKVGTGSVRIPLDTGNNTISLGFLGDTGTAIVEIADLSIGHTIGVKPRVVELVHPALRRTGSLLRVDLPASMSDAELTLVSVDGRVWSRAQARDGAASLTIPGTRRPYWVRIQGRTTGAIPVPPGL